MSENKRNDSSSSNSTEFQDEYSELLKYSLILEDQNEDVKQQQQQQQPQAKKNKNSSFPNASIPSKDDKPVVTFAPGAPPNRNNNATNESTNYYRPGGQQWTSGSEFSRPVSSIPLESTHISARPYVDVNTPSFDITSPCEGLTSSSAPQGMNDSMISTTNDYSNTYGTNCPPNQNQMSLDESDITHVGQIFDRAAADLKNKVMGEFAQAKIKYIEMNRRNQHQEQQHAAQQMNVCREQQDSLRELLVTYERSIDRKDSIISNLTCAMQKQREKNCMMQSFADWKMNYNELKKECYGSTMADKHYRSVILRRAFFRWKSHIRFRWQERVNEICKQKAEEICIQLQNEHRMEMNQMAGALDCAKQEVARLTEEKQAYETNMKRAFMRGLCALNMEAQNMFNDDDAVIDIPQRIVHNEQNDHCNHLADIVYEVDCKDNEQDDDVLQMTNNPPPCYPQFQASRKPMKLNVKCHRNEQAAPPMNSVVIQRHQVVPKKTMAPKSRFNTFNNYNNNNSRNTAKKPTPLIHRKIAGQSD